MMTAVQMIVAGVIALGGLYVGAWIVSRAFFDNKADYNRKLLRQMEDHGDAEDAGKGR